MEKDADGFYTPASVRPSCLIHSSPSHSMADPAAPAPAATEGAAEKSDAGQSPRRPRHWPHLIHRSHGPHQVHLRGVGECLPPICALDAPRSRVQVTLGRSSVALVEVVEGLREGDQVVLSDMSAWDGFNHVRFKD